MPGCNIPHLKKIIAIATALFLTGCGEENHYVAPPPPKVAVATALQQPVTRYLEATGSVAAVNSADLVARVQGFLQEIKYQDGATVKKGTPLFVIEPQPYQLKHDQAKAAEQGSEASLKQLEAEFQRQQDLASKQVASKSAYDQALAARDGAKAKLAQAQVDSKTAEINLGYTQVKAPFDGIVGARQVSVGELVGGGGADDAGHHRPARSDLRQFQHQRAGCAEAARGSGAARAQAVGHERHAGRGRPADRGRLSRTRARSNTLRRPSTSRPARSPCAASIAQSRPQAAAGLFRARARSARTAAERRCWCRTSRSAAIRAGAMCWWSMRTMSSSSARSRPAPLVGALRVIESGLTPDDRVVVAGLLRAIPGPEGRAAGTQADRAAARPPKSAPDDEPMP